MVRLNISSKALALLQLAYSRVNPPFCAELMWEQVLVPQDRIRLGGDLEKAYKKYRNTVGMWQYLRRVSINRATIDLGLKMNAITIQQHEWLLREIGEDEPEQTLEQAIRSHKLVLTENPKAVYWKGKQLKIDWRRNNKAAYYFWELVHCAQSGKEIELSMISNSKDDNYLSKKKNYLTDKLGLPIQLADLIVASGCRMQRLDIPPEEIRIFQKETIEVLREYLP